MAFLDVLERFFAELYPYRWPILIGLVAMISAVVAFGYWKGWHTWIWQRRQGVAIIATPVLVLVIVGHRYPSVWNY